MSQWLEVIEWMKSVSVKLQPRWPKELPAESHPQFWQIAARLEFETRDAVSVKLTTLVTTGELPSTTDLENWFFHRRFEWAAQLAGTKARSGVQPPVPLREVLLWALVKTWESDGCIAFWNHHERGGKPHPETPTNSFEQ